MQGHIGKRIRALREARQISQDDLARLFGFRDRQTVSAIETGIRRVSADELLLAVEKLGASLDYFTDPFLLVGEGRFSWRRDGADDNQLEAYERKAGPPDRSLPHLGSAGRPQSSIVAADACSRTACAVRGRGASR